MGLLPLIVAGVHMGAGGEVVSPFDPTIPENATFVFPGRPTRFVFPARPRAFVFPGRAEGFKE